jgi:hypothetical protein
MTWWAVMGATMALFLACCTMPAWLKDDGPVVPHETFTGIDGSENQRPGMRLRDGGSSDAQ